MSIAILRQWLGPAAPSPHDTKLRRLVRDALIEHDALVAEQKRGLSELQEMINSPLSAADLNGENETCSQCGLVDECRCHGVQSSDDLDAEGEAP